MSDAASEALNILSALVVDDEGHRWGEIAEPLQWEDAKAILTPNSATPYHFLTRARGRSKTTDLGGMAIAAMATQLGAGSNSYAAASNRDQAALLLDAISSMAMRTPELADAFDIQASRVVCLTTGATLTTLPADGSGAHGLRPDLLIVDEIAQWQMTRTAMEFYRAIRSAAHKIKGCRMVLLTSAGHPAHWAARELKHAKSSPLWRVNEAPGPAPWTPQDRLDEQRGALPDSVFRRYFMNEWTEGNDGVRREDVEACIRDAGPLAWSGKRTVIGVDLSTTTDYTVVAVAHLEADDQESVVVVDHLRTWKPSRGRPVPLAEVAEHIAEMHRAYRGEVHADPYQAMQMLQALQAAGVRAESAPMTTGANNRRATLLFQLLRTRRLSLPNDDPDLVEELSAIALKETSPGMFKLDVELSGLGHHDRATAISICAERLLDRPVSMSARVWLERHLEDNPEVKAAYRPTDWDGLKQRARDERKARRRAILPSWPSLGTSTSTLTRKLYSSPTARD